MLLLPGGWRKRATSWKFSQRYSLLWVIRFQMSPQWQQRSVKNVEDSQTAYGSKANSELNLGLQLSPAIPAQ